MARMKYDLVGEIGTFDYHGSWGDYCSPRSLKDWLAKLGADDEGEITINSPGGSVIQGVEMANAIKNCKARIVAHVTGIAASMASVVACACDAIEMEEASFLMIHNPWSYVEGDAEELRKQAGLLDQMKAVIMSFYRGKFKGLSDDQISALMSDETWYTGAECQANGLDCTVIASDVRAAASLVGHKFAKIPAGAAKFLTAPELTDEGRAEIEAARAAAAAPAPSAPTPAPAPAAPAASAAAPSAPAAPAAPAPVSASPCSVSAAQAAETPEIPETPEPTDWEARYKGASKKINELSARLAACDAAKKEQAATIAARDATIREFEDQVKASGYENLAALVGAVSGLKADLEKRGKDLAATREQLDHLKQTRDLLTGGVLTPKDAADSYEALMAKATTPEARESLRAKKRAGKIK